MIDWSGSIRGNELLDMVLGQSVFIATAEKQARTLGGLTFQKLTFDSSERITRPPGIEINIQRNFMPVK